MMMSIMRDRMRYLFR